MTGKIYSLSVVETCLVSVQSSLLPIHNSVDRDKLRGLVGLARVDRAGVGKKSRASCGSRPRRSSERATFFVFASLYPLMSMRK
jgi:hypothetical protein